MTFYHGNSILGAGAGFFRLHLRFRQHVAFAGDPHVQRRRQKNAQDQRHYQAAYDEQSFRHNNRENDRRRAIQYGGFWDRWQAHHACEIDCEGGTTALRVVVDTDAVIESRASSTILFP